MTRIEFCEKSTITEAWVVLMGPSGPVEEPTFGIVQFLAKKELKDLVPEPSFVVVPAGADAPPFWAHQVAWHGGRYRARFGHRFLSVHFVRDANDEQRYERFGTSLEPQIATWRAIISNAVLAEHFPITRIAFGYVNSFAFPAKDFSTPDYFKLSVESDLDVTRTGTDAVDVRIRVGGAMGELNHVDVGVVAVSDTVRVTSKVVVERQLNGPQVAGDAETTASIVTVKESAKALFADLTTEKAHLVMGAHYAE